MRGRWWGLSQELDVLISSVTSSAEVGEFTFKGWLRYGGESVRHGQDLLLSGILSAGGLIKVPLKATCNS